MQFDVIPYDMIQGVSHWLKVLAVAAIFVIIVPALASIGLMGLRGPKAVFLQVWEGLRDFADISFRRIWALAMLTFREAVRRKALLVFVVFAVLFMFGSWFLGVDNEKADIQIERYVVFVFTAISWLVLPVVLLLACWGIPEDIKARSMHTVVTKPVRRLEIVLGRMLGFSVIATILVALMSVVGYFWIVRQVSTSTRDRLVCKVPLYGAMTFYDREGNASRTGINVGDIWDFRSYLEGATKAHATWVFSGIDKSALTKVDLDGQVQEVLRLQTNFESFRTYKGTIEKGLLCEFTLVNEAKGLRVPLPPFEVAEYRPDGNLTEIERKVSFHDPAIHDRRVVDVLDDVVSDGTLTVEVRCLSALQYLGMARPDLFIRKVDRSFAVGYFKAAVAVWLQVLMVVMIGVAASCFVKGPIATLLTFSMLVVGAGFHEIIGKIVAGEQLGGGPIESVYRIIMHLNQTVDMDLSKPVTAAIKNVDWVLNQGIWLVQQVFPDFSRYSMTAYVAKGFDVDFRAALLPSIAITLAFIVPCVLIGYYSLKLRELESK